MQILDSDLQELEQAKSYLSSASETAKDKRTKDNIESALECVYTVIRHAHSLQSQSEPAYKNGCPILE